MPFVRAILGALLASTLLATQASPAAAHSELVASSPAAGALVIGGPAEITGEFSQPVDSARSSMELRAPNGAPVARGGVPEGGPATRMTITGIPPLAPGRYSVRWTTVTPDDDGVERGTFRFTVEAPTASPSPSAPSPTPAVTTSDPTTAPPATLPSTATPEPPATPAADIDPQPTAGTADILVPLVVLGAVLAGGAAWLVRRRR